MKDSRKLNLACGHTKLEGYLNVDIDPKVEPDLVMNVQGFFPFETDYFETVVFMHAIEHIDRNFHPSIYEEIRRVLKPNGKFILGYPEFAVCAKFWLENYHGKRDFWEACIYGRGLSEFDRHVCAMDSREVKELLEVLGFKDIILKEEPHNPQYTILAAYKGEPMPTYEKVIAETVFGKQLCLK